jgi:hypothetical protein
MIDNTKVYKCACSVKGLKHSFTTDMGGKFVLMVDQDRAHLLRDTGWRVGKMHRKSKVLRARAFSRAPGIKRGAQLHQLVMRTRSKQRRVWSVTRNYLDCRRENLRSLTHADVRILSSTRPSTQAIGVTRPPQPKFFLTLLRPFHARISVGGTTLDLAWWATVEEASAAYDAAALMVHGPTATTNQSLGLLSAEVTRTRPCHIAAKTARRVIREHRSGELAKRYEALKTAKTYAEKAKVWAGVRAVGQPLPGPRAVSQAAH